MGRLDQEGLPHLKEPLKEQTVAGLVDLMRTDRPKFLPTLQKLGVTKLPDRQKVRDIINYIANPPAGSEDKLREEYKKEFETWPWACVQGEKYIVDSEVATMVSQLPEGRTLKKYRIRNLNSDTISVQVKRSSNSASVGSAGLSFSNGEIIVGDDESWSVDDPTLRVHVYVQNKVQPSMGYFQGWVNYVDLIPLDEEGEPPRVLLDEKGNSSYATQRKIQEYFMDGYYQLSLCRAIKQGITEKPDGMTFRQALDLIYMKVRGPALIKLGYMPNNKGLAEYMATVDSAEYVHLSDDEYKAIIDDHNRIVALMGGQNPSVIVDSLALRRAGQGVDIADALAGEPAEERAEEGAGVEGVEAKEGAEGAPVAAPAAAPSVEGS